MSKSKGNSRIVLNSRGVRSLLRSKEMLSICKDYAYTAKSRLGDGYEVTYRVGKNRVNASVAAVTPKAVQENKEDHTIRKALGLE